MASPMKKGNKISQIVRLKQVMQRWRRRCVTTDPLSSDSDSETNQQQNHRHRIPSAGSLAVYVGAEHRRFVIPTRYLNLPVFVSLLNKAEEEFGFQSTGGLVLPCDVSFFKQLLKVLERDETGFGALDFDDFSKMFSDLAVDSSYSCKEASNSNCHSFTPLLQKTRV